MQSKKLKIWKYWSAPTIYWPIKYLQNENKENKIINTNNINKSINNQNNIIKKEQNKQQNGGEGEKENIEGYVIVIDNINNDDI